MPESLETLQERYASFVDRRGWDQYHTPQNLAMAISVEASEFMENFLWFNNPPSEDVANDPQLMGEIEDELADILIYSIALANQLDIDLLEAVERKMEANEERFDEERVTELACELEQWQ